MSRLTYAEQEMRLYSKIMIDTKMQSTFLTLRFNTFTCFISIGTICPAKQIIILVIAFQRNIPYTRVPHVKCRSNDKKHNESKSWNGGGLEDEHFAKALLVVKYKLRPCIFLERIATSIRVITRAREVAFLRSAKEKAWNAGFYSLLRIQVLGKVIRVALNWSGGM